MSKGSAPAAPDPYTTAQAQYQYGTEAADYSTALNDINTVGPTGTTGYAITGVDPTTGAPIRTQTTTLTPAEQSILTGTQGIQQSQVNTAGNLLGEFNTELGTGAPSIAPINYGPTAGPVQNTISTSGVPGIESIQGLEGLEQQGQSTALAGEEAAAQPGMTQAREQLDASLRNSGAHPGDPAYDNAMAALDASQTQQQTQLAGAAINAGTGLENTVYGEEANTNSQLFSQAQQEEQAFNTAQQQQFGEGTTAAGTSNAAGTTALADWANQLGVPLNELSAILGGSQVSSPSSISPTGATVSAPDIMSAFQNQYAGELSNYNAGVQTTNSEYGDLASLGMLAYLAAA
jgi:hypothetical protein